MNTLKKISLIVLVTIGFASCIVVPYGPPHGHYHHYHHHHYHHHY